MGAVWRVLLGSFPVVCRWLGFRVFGLVFHVAPGLALAAALKTFWLSHSGHPDCLGAPL